MANAEMAYAEEYVRLTGIERKSSWDAGKMVDASPLHYQLIIARAEYEIALARMKRGE